MPRDVDYEALIRKLRQPPPAPVSKGWPRTLGEWWALILSLLNTEII